MIFNSYWSTFQKPGESDLQKIAKGFPLDWRTKKIEDNFKAKAKYGLKQHSIGKELDKTIHKNQKRVQEYNKKYPSHKIEL